MPISYPKAVKRPYAELSAEKQRKSFKLLWLLVFAFVLYIILVGLGIYYHEPWRDEAQAWLIARDASVTELFRLLPSEGHPPLWYLLLMPFAKAGFPYQTVNWLNGLMMVAAVYLIMFKTALPAYIKLLIPFSYFFLFEYAEIARNYCLAVFFCAAIISIYPRRFAQSWLYAVCVIGLFNSHVLIFSFALALVFLYVTDAGEQKKINLQTVISMLLMLAGGLYLIPYIGLSHMAAAMTSTNTDHAAQMMQAITNGLLVTDMGYLPMVLLAIMALLLTGKTKPFLSLIAGLAGILYILGYRYNGYIWHQGLIFVVVFTTYGIAGYYQHDKTNIIADNKLINYKYGFAVLALIIILQSGSTISSYKNDIDRPYSGAKNAAAYLIENHLDNFILVGQQAWATSAIVPYLPGKKDFYYAECQRYGSYYVYDSCFLESKWAYPASYAVKVAYENFQDRLDSIILVLNMPLSPAMSKYVTLLYTNPDRPIREDEWYYIYKFKKNLSK